MLKPIEKYRILFLLLLSGFVHNAYGQEEFNASAGIGFSEMINVGIRYKHNQTQFGIYLGGTILQLGWGYPRTAIITVSGDMSLYFRGRSEKPKSYSRYYRLKIVCGYVIPGGYDNGYYISLTPLSFGREINISDNFGINVDIGFGIMMVDINDLDENKFFVPSPSGSIGLFYRLYE